MQNTARTPLESFVQRHSLTQRVVAEGSGLTLSNINGIIRGHQRPRIDTAVKIVDFLREYDPGVTLDDIFGSASRDERVAHAS
jgi:DNA-binding XRE family transcriptional regulator